MICIFYVYLFFWNLIYCKEDNVNVCNSVYIFLIGELKKNMKGKILV